MSGTRHLAQINIGRTVAPLDHPQLAGFVQRLAEINALADQSRVPRGHIPSVEEGKQRLAQLAADGPSAEVFWFGSVLSTPPTLSGRDDSVGSSGSASQPAEE